MLKQVLKTASQKAFPSERFEVDIYGNKQPMGNDGGMDLRDYFAAKAMEALLIDESCTMAYPKLCEYSYEIADEMMEARNATK